MMTKPKPRGRPRKSPGDVAVAITVSLPSRLVRELDKEAARRRVSRSVLVQERLTAPA